MADYSEPELTLTRRILLAANRIFARGYHHLRVLAPCRLPRRGPAILVSNHTSALDPVLLQAVCPRPIVWMMAREYYEMPSLGWLYRQVQAIPVERSGRDMPATREALRALRAGRILGIFPEGKWEERRELLPFHSGVALMASKAEVEIFPAYLDGTQRGKDMAETVLRPQQAQVMFGPGIGLPGSLKSRQSLEGATTNVQSAVQRLLEAAHVAIDGRAGRDDDRG
jgi:1-acyl-sn-glycerol-3-phosphate acyltransferase